jgi:hypothetical protein
MTEFCKHTDSVIRIIEENDANGARSAEVARELYRERKNSSRHLSRTTVSFKKLKIISLSSQGLQESERVMIQTHQTQSIHLPKVCSA